MSQVKRGISKLIAIYLARAKHRRQLTLSVHSIALR